MKKVALILLILIYSMSSFGVGLKEFYCCGKLKSVSLTLIDSAKEKCNKGDNKGGCCQSKYQYLQVKDKHFASVHPTLPLKHSVELVSTISPAYTISFIPQDIDITNGSHAPPLITSVPIYIVNCVFRI